MHWCPYCSNPCWCDGDDTDMGISNPDECPHVYCDEDDRDYEYDDESEE